MKNSVSVSDAMIEAGSRALSHNESGFWSRAGTAERALLLAIYQAMFDQMVEEAVGEAVVMRILIACEFSGVVRRAFRARGHDAWSCDLLPAEDGDLHHIQGDALAILDDGWDMMIAHPPCQYLCSSGLHWNKRVPGRAAKTEEALAFVSRLMLAPIPRIALENPMGRIGTAIRRANQTVQPYQFGHDASKATGLWLKGLPKLRPTAFVEPRIVNGRKRWGNQTNSGQNRLGPSPTRAQDRARTYEGIAAAMAEQWGGMDAPGHAEQDAALGPQTSVAALAKAAREAWERDFLRRSLSRQAALTI